MCNDKNKIYSSSSIDSVITIVFLFVFIGIFFLLLFSSYFLLALIEAVLIYYLLKKALFKLIVFEDRIELIYLLSSKKKKSFSAIDIVKFARGVKGSTVLLIRFKDNTKAMINEEDLLTLVKILNTFHENKVKIIRNKYWRKRIDFKNNSYYAKNKFEV